MRACVLTTVHPYNDNRIYYKQIRTLLAAGYRVTYVAPCPGGVEDLDGVELVPLPMARSWRRPLNWLRAAKAALASSADLFHFHDPELIPVGLLLKLVTGKPIVYDVHEDHPKAMLTKTWIPRGLHRVAAATVCALESMAIRGSDALVAAASSVYERLEQRGATPVLVRNFVDTRMFEGDRQADCTEDDGPYLVYVGVITAERGILDCVASFAAMGRQDASLVLVGRVDRSDPALRRVHDDPPGGVVFRERVSFDQVPSLLRCAHAGIVPPRASPRYRYALSTKLLEYMAASIPVIASDLPGIRVIVDEADCGLLVEPGSTEDLAQAMAYILDHPEEAAAMGRRGRRVVSQHYSWEPEGAMLVGLYDELLHRNGKRTATEREQ